jgi:hypothetical protein
MIHDGVADGTSGSGSIRLLPLMLARVCSRAEPIQSEGARDAADQTLRHLGKTIHAFSSGVQLVELYESNSIY